MQALIPFVVALSLASASKLSLVPYAYLANPVPVYNQHINTKTGEHAYSYAGGPSAKQEIKDANGVVTGSYSYIDANSVLQSVYYVADDGGFRVLATNLPSDDDLNTEAGHIILARSTKEGAQATSSRRKRRAVEPPMEKKKAEPVLVEQKPLEVTRPEVVEQKPMEVTTSEVVVEQKPMDVTTTEVVAEQKPMEVTTSEVVVEQKPVEKSKPELKISLPPTLKPIIPYATSHQRQIHIHQNGQLEIPKLQVILQRTPTDPTTIQLTGSPYGNYLNDVSVRGDQLIVVLPYQVVFPEARVALEPLATSLTTSVSSYDISQIHESSKIQKSLPKTQKLETAPAKEEMNSASTNPSLTSGEASSSMSQEKEVNTIILNEPIDLFNKIKEPSLTISSHGISQLHPSSQIIIPPYSFGHPIPRVD